MKFRAQRYNKIPIWRSRRQGKCNNQPALRLYGFFSAFFFVVNLSFRYLCVPNVTVILHTLLILLLYP